MRLCAILVVLLAIACASAHDTPRDSGGLVRVKSWKPGNLFADLSRSIDDYDDIWIAEVGLQYAEGQQRLAEADERSLRKMVYGIALAEIAAGQLTARQAGPCTLKLGVHLAALSFPPPAVVGPRRESAVVISELRDSQTDEPLVRYGQRREGASRRRATDGAADLDRVEATLRNVIHDFAVAMGESVPLNPTGARAGLGCKGKIGQVRREFRASH